MSAQARIHGQSPPIARLRQGRGTHVDKIHQAVVSQQLAPDIAHGPADLRLASRRAATTAPRGRPRLAHCEVTTAHEDAILKPDVPTLPERRDASRYPSRPFWEQRRLRRRRARRRSDG
ncbi:hypothetical protein GCM10010411_76100 [Actinomadura fulvescens]|uniref:Uncharacterized protein n=1 Tax=Actinomadura fulvescens TaxID=46160 RepID=A0ABP6CYS8_9ACTN